jgi:hypothetical protein
MNKTKKSHDNYIARCVCGPSCAPFGCHPSDQEGAFQYLTWLRKNGIGWREAREEIKSYHLKTIANKEYIKKQLKMASTLLRPWILD